MIVLGWGEWCVGVLLIEKEDRSGRRRRQNGVTARSENYKVLIRIWTYGEGLIKANTRGE